MQKCFCAIVLSLMLALPFASLARVGVGVGTGKIIVDQPLKPGMINVLPSLTVINTGDEPSEYEVGVQYHTDQPEIKPERDWFIFSPAEFELGPGEAQVVNIKMNLPVNAKPGKYFAYLEGRPIKESTTPGGATIGVAAAAKLYFDIAPANFIMGMYYRLTSFWKVYAPWTNIVAIVVAAAIVVLLFRKYFSFNLGISLKHKEKIAENPKKNPEEKEKKQSTKKEKTNAQ